mmetsp:Transcript_29055/g.63656  ORF Transcript_29055/g.63656 Transcript_29055/m.63656 type:complete len:248 (-) Transcript_29055:3640-4383(-)
MMMPLSIENASVGSPCRFHARIWTASPTISCRSNLVDEGMRFSSMSAIQSAMACRRYGIEKGPKYAMTAELRSTSPTSLVYLGPRASEISCQRTRSPPSPAMSFSARSSLALQSSYLRSSSSLVAASCASLASMAASLSSTFCSSARLSSSPCIASAYSPSDTLSAAFLGATTLATRSYTSMAQIHLHRPSHAVDALAMRSGVKSSFGMYTSRIFLMILGGMLSLSYALRLSTKAFGSISSFLPGPK